MQSTCAHCSTFETWILASQTRSQMFFNLKSKVHNLEYFQNAVKGSSLAFLHPSYKAWHFIVFYVPNARALVHVNDCFLTATSLLSKKIYKAAKKTKKQTNKNKLSALHSGKLKCLILFKVLVLFFSYYNTDKQDILYMDQIARI